MVGLSQASAEDAVIEQEVDDLLAISFIDLCLAQNSFQICRLT